MKNYALCLLVLLCALTSAFAQDKLNQELDKSLEAYEINHIDLNALYNQLNVPNKFHSTEIQIGKEKFKLQLWDTGLYADETKLTLASGKEYTGTRPVPLKGHIDGDLSSSARITINQNFLHGYIKIGDQVLNFQPANTYEKSVDQNLIVSYYSADLKELETPGTCQLHVHEDYVRKKVDKEIGEKSVVGECYEIDFAIAADWLMVDKMGSVNGADNEVVAILNTVQGNYDDEFADAIEFSISDVWISDCSSCDPWTSSTDPGLLLDDFSDWAPGELGSHDDATLWTARDFDGSTVGLAWLGTACSGLSYNVCEHFTTDGDFLRVTQAHEIGHNLNAVHDSGGSHIMAPSTSTTTTWSSESETDILAFAEDAGCFGGCSGGTPPTADFTFEIIAECAVGEVEFEDLSSLATEWLWTFEGGTPSTSTDQHPTVTYAEAGTYDVTLEVTNAAGDDELEANNAIEILPPPEVDFDHFHYGLEVEFEDETGAAGGAEYFWDFGDGNTSDEQNPVHTYSAPGIYTVILELEDDCGFGSDEQEIEVFDEPLADFTADVTSICAGDTVKYTDLSYGNIEEWIWTFSGGTPATSSLQNPEVRYDVAGLFNTELDVSNPEGSDILVQPSYINVLSTTTAGFTFSVDNNVVTFTNSSVNGGSYLWNFGDGNTSTVGSPTHTYTTPGNFTVTLTSTNICNVSNSSQVVNINLAPIAAFTTNQTPSGCADLSLSYIDSSLGNPTSWNWSFPGGNPATSTLQSPSTTYTQRGTYPVTLICQNSFGADTVTMSNFVSINDVPELTASFVENLLTVNFTSTPNFYDSILWNFGDGNTSAIVSPTHSYAVEGTYNVTVTATNTCGSATQTMTVNPSLLPKANITSNVTEGCEGMVVSYSNDSNSTISTYSWNFPGGSPATSTSPNPVVTYNTAGSYDASLTVTNNAGNGSETLTNYIQVLTTPTISYNNVLNGNQLSLTNTSPGTSASWTISDGATSNQQSFTHSFVENGNYQVTLEVTNICGSVSESFNVNVDAYPTAAFSVGNVNGCTPLVVTFENNSTQATSYSWSFPGGNPSASNATNPVVTYDQEGVFDVTLTVSNAYGSDQVVNNQLISVGTLEDLTYTSNLIGNVLKLENTTPGTNTQWTISDGTVSNAQTLDHTFQENGDYEVTLRVQNGCGEQEVTFSVSVDAYPEGGINLDQTSIDETSGCIPLTITYQASSTNADNYNWNFPGGNPSTSTDANPTVTYEFTGNYDVNLELSNAYGSLDVTEGDYVNAFDVPMSEFDIDQNDNYIDLNNNSVDADAFEWDFGDGNTSTVENPSHSYELPGIYEVRLTATNECGFSETIILVDVQVLSSVNQKATNEWSLSPNPTTGQLTLKFESVLTTELNYQIADLTGRIIQSNTLTAGTNEKNILIEHSGVYLAIIKQDDKISVQRVVVLN